MTETSRNPTLEDVARRAGVSRALVSLALRNSTRVAAETRANIARAAADIGYRPNLAARNLASHRTGTIGVLLNDLHNPFFAEVYDGISAASDEHHLQVLLTTGAERNAVESMMQHRVDGIVLVGPRLPTAEIARVADQIPITVVGRTLRSNLVDCVINNDATGTHLAVSHLHELGHHHIVHVDGGKGAGAQARRLGFTRAAELFDMRAEVLSGDFTEAAGSHAARQLIRRKRLPTAIFGANDLVAVGTIDVLEQAGYLVPRDVSVLGYDNSAVARMAHLSLTSVAQPTRDMGRIAVEALIERIGGRSTQRVELVEPTLIARTTTAAAVTAR